MSDQISKESEARMSDEITEAEIEAGAIGLWIADGGDLASWNALEVNGRDDYRESSEAVLDAVKKAKSASQKPPSR